MDVNDYGSTFVSRDLHNAEEITRLQWSPFNVGTKYFAPSKKEFMINYRVQNIEGLLKKLYDNGAIIVDTIQDSEYGKFVHIMDADGNKIELWEPK
jgi:predicted enzyme related to lactoylglutathione lyase